MEKEKKRGLCESIDNGIAQSAFFIRFRSKRSTVSKSFPQLPPTESASEVGRP